MVGHFHCHSFFLRGQSAIRYTNIPERKEICEITCWSFPIPTWYPKQPLFNGCFSWMIPNLYSKNGCFTKHPLKNGCLGYQVLIIPIPSNQRGRSIWFTPSPWRSSFLALKTNSSQVCPWKKNRTGLQFEPKKEKHINSSSNHHPFLFGGAVLKTPFVLFRRGYGITV